MPWLRLWALPVLPVSWSLEHWMELLPSWVDEESWLRSALSPSCSFSWVTWAMAGMAATASIAKSAASIINFFNFYLFSSVILAESFTLDRNYTRRSGLLYTFFKISSPILSPGAEKMAPRKAQRLQRCVRAALLGVRA